MLLFEFIYGFHRDAHDVHRGQNPEFFLVLHGRHALHGLIKFCFRIRIYFNSTLVLYRPSSNLFSSDFIATLRDLFSFFERLHHLRGEAEA